MKRLFRDRSNRMVGGVASGLAAYLDIDPVLVRVGFVLGAFANGIGILDPLRRPEVDHPDLGRGA